MLKDLVVKNRSYRRFFQGHKILTSTLKELIELARFSPSARNAQPLKYILSNEDGLNSRIFPCLTWARDLPNWNGPVEGERPSAYIIMLADTTISKEYFCDHGIAAQSILLGATEKKLGGCIIASVQREKLQKELNIPGYLKILQVIALGKPKEKVILEEVIDPKNTKYWRDKDDIHHVPKRPLEDLIYKLGH